MSCYSFLGGILIFSVRAKFLLTLTLQKSKIPQVQGIKVTAVVACRKALITQEMRCHRLSSKVNNTAKKGAFIEYNQRLDFMMVTQIDAKLLSNPFNVLSDVLFMQ
jgi:hypothetical protein